MANSGEFFKSFDDYKNLLETIVREKIADNDFVASDELTNTVIKDICEHKFEEVHVCMALIDIDNPNYASKEYQDVETIVELYVGINIAEQQKLIAAKAEQTRQQELTHTKERQSLVSKALDAKSQEADSSLTALQQDLNGIKPQQELSQKAAQLEEILRVNFGKTFADLVNTNNRRFEDIGHPDLAKTPVQYTERAKIARILHDINSLQKDQFCQECMSLIDSKKTSKKDKILISELKDLVLPVFNVLESDGNLNSVYTNRWQKFVEVSNSDQFNTTLNKCSSSIRKKFLDICICILTLGYIKPQNSAEKFAKSTQQVMSVSAQVNKILHGHHCGTGVTVVPVVKRKRDRVMSKLYKLQDFKHSVEEQVCAIGHRVKL